MLDELRKAILRHDWEMTARLTMLLCNSGITRYSTVIIRVSIHKQIFTKLPIVTLNSFPDIVTSFAKSSKVKHRAAKQIPQVSN